MDDGRWTMADCRWPMNGIDDLGDQLTVMKEVRARTRETI